MKEAVKFLMEVGSYYFNLIYISNLNMGKSF